MTTKICPCQLQGFAQEGEGAAVSTALSATGVSAWRSIGIGVVTGLTVWLVTRLLDGRRGSRRRRHRR